MSWKNATVAVGLVFALAISASAAADIKDVMRCQKKFARAGANFAGRTIKATLRCTNAISLCQIQCEQGVFGPACGVNPPPCCDPDDPNSNETFGFCMMKAAATCDKMTAKIAAYEFNKQSTIFNACIDLTTEELCGAEMPGLNYAILSAGCQALDPNFTCTLPNLINCVGGPMEHALANQISSLLDARAAEAISTLNLGADYPGIPGGRMMKGDVAAGTVDIWAISGVAGEELTAKVDRRRDTSDDASDMQPTLLLLDQDGLTPLADTNMVEHKCGIMSTCGGICPQFTRRLPFNGTFYIAVGAMTGEGCSGGKYKLVVRSTSGTRPTLVADDIQPGTFSR